MKLILRWIIVAVSLFAAAWLLPGIRVDGNAYVVLGIAAVISGLVNAVVRPLLKFLSCPLIILTLGLFTLVINAAMLSLTSYLAVNFLNVGFYVNGFIPALLGSIIVSVVSVVLSIFVKDDQD